MTARIGIALALLLASGFFGLAASLTSMRMVDEVNAKLSKEQQFGLLGWHYFKSRKMIQEYRRLYPSGRLIARELTLEAIGVVLFLVAADLIMGSLVTAWLATGVCVAAWLMYRR